MQKYYILIYFTIFIFSCFPKKNTNYSNSKLLLNSDSGFITKQIGLQFLIKNNLADTINKNWDKITDIDTVGKYYRIPNSDNYYLFTSVNPNDEILLSEVDSSGKVFQLKKFYHGNWSCCWKNKFNGFYKFGNFFGIKTCGSGSAYCSSFFYFFKKLTDQDNIKSIPFNVFSSGINGEVLLLNSTFNFSNQNNLFFEYKLEKGKTDTNNEIKIFSTKYYKIKFTFLNNNWLTNDSSKFEELISQLNQ
ncbi:MAG: hypothetical protein RJA07_2547 [Bacteroidota bacterium]|jgi:hypothetical protein